MGKYKNLDEALLDVEARFLNNLPESQLTQVICVVLYGLYALFFNVLSAYDAFLLG